MTVIVDSDPLAPTTLPATPFSFQASKDEPSGAGVRPFGLTRAVAVPRRAVESVEEMRFDPRQQLSVTAEGSAWIENSGKRPSTMSGVQTQNDHQYEQDIEVDD